MNKRKALESTISKINVTALSDEQLAAIEKIIKEGNNDKKKIPHDQASNKAIDTALQTILMVMKPFAIAIADIKGNVIVKNETMNLLLGDAFSTKKNIFTNKLFIDAAGKEKLQKLKTFGTVHIDELWYEKPTKVKGVTTPICVHALIFPLFDIYREITNFVIIHVDITRHKLAERSWKESEEKFNLIFENNQQAVYYECDMSGKITELSPSIELVSKFKREEMIGNKIQDYYFDPKERELLIKEIYSNHRVSNFRIRVKDKNGKPVQLIVNAKLVIDSKGKPKKIIGLLMDVTTLYKTSVELKNSEERYRELFENTNDIIYTMDLKGNFTSVNPMAEKMLGYKFTELKEMNMSSYISPETAKLAFANIQAKVKGKKLNTMYEVDFINKNRTYTSLEINSQLRFKDGKPYEIFGIARNISERKKANEAIKKSEEKYRLIFENAPLGILTADIKGNIIEANAPLVKLMGSPSLEETKKINLLKSQIGIEAGFVAAFKRSIKSGEEMTTESAYTSRWGVNLYLKLYIKPLKDQKGKVTGFQTIVEDISEQKESDRQIKEALSEKEILIREIHHRVKNNMQVIISLINMQTYESKDEEMVVKLKELQQRVRTMAIIHEDLYRSDDLSKINFGEYLHKLTGNLLQIYPRKYEIDLKYKVTNAYLNINTAIPCGLILNELLSNSFKYAFPEKWRESHKKTKPEIFIEFRSTNKHYHLVVGDNGVGIPERDKNLKRDTLGLELVEILVAQMKGNMKQLNKNGTRYEIEIEK